MAIRDLMNNYFYGKQGKGDYTVADMPQNRFALFGEVLKVRWSGLFGVNLLYMIAWIPAIIWTFLNLIALYNLLQADPGTSPGDVAGLLNTWLMILAPCIAITGPFNACWRFYGNMLAQSLIFMLPAALVLLVGVLWTLASMLAYPMLITYELKTIDVIRNSLLMTVAKLPRSVLIKLATLIVPALAYGLMVLIPNIQMQVLMVVSLLYLTFMVAFNKLITVSYANALFETYLNPRIEGARTNIGLRPENWDDVTYIPEDDEK